MKRVVVFAVVLLSLAGLAAQAGVPTVINYQGKLMQPSGEPVLDGTYEMTFAIYDVPVGGTALWSETASVQVKDGLYSVLLGSVTPIQPPVFSGPDRWFGIKVGDASEMVPRQKIASVAYAQVASTAQTVELGAVTAPMLAPGVATPPGTISMYAGISAPPGWLLCQGQAVSRTTYAPLFAAIGTRYGLGNGSTTFNLPNLQSRFPIGASGAYALATTGGSATKNLQHYHATANHKLTIGEMPSHTHTVWQMSTQASERIVAKGNVRGNYKGYQSDPTGGNEPHNHGNTGPGLSAQQDVMNPYLAINYIIRL